MALPTGYIDYRRFAGRKVSILETVCHLDTGCKEPAGLACSSWKARDACVGVFPSLEIAFCTALLFSGEGK